MVAPIKASNLRKVDRGVDSGRCFLTNSDKTLGATVRNDSMADCGPLGLLLFFLPSFQPNRAIRSFKPFTNKNMFFFIY